MNVLPRYADYPDNSTIEAGNVFQDWCQIKLLEIGILFQCFTSRRWQYQVGESTCVEAKLDSPCLRTQRLSIEFQERKSVIQPWVNSGILRSPTWLYAQGIPDQVVFVFATDRLKELHASNRYEYHEAPKFKPTMRGFFLPFSDARQAALKIWERGKGWTK